MCGILFQIVEIGQELVQDPSLVYQVSCRGPDSLKTVERSAHGHLMSFTSSVLHLRGRSVHVQPSEDNLGNILCWNGEVWDGLGGDRVEGNDTLALATALEGVGSDVYRVFETIRGPYAFVYYQVTTSSLTQEIHAYPPRSKMGKYGQRNQTSWTEVDTTSIFCYNLQTRNTSSYPWVIAKSRSGSSELQRPYPAVSTEIPPTSWHTNERSQDIYTTAISEFHSVLAEAVRIRTITIPAYSADPSGTSRVAVMYSGGVDCALLARLLHDELDAGEPIDLLNVSFENPRTITNAQKTNPNFNVAQTYETPDRLTGRQGYEELRRTCPQRDWRFISIDVSYREAIAAKDAVLDLMFPNDSVMDHSIALAFYFCARGQGTLTRDDGPDLPYHSTARVYFSGLGADEQVGGYSRHMAAWREGGHPALVHELQRDLDRIPTRNLGRDDRILAHFAREVRWPFLDERVIGFLCRLRVDVKMDFTLPRGSGDKWILRELARRLGLVLAAGEPKRAIQFGSRSARMEIEHGKGDRVKGHQKHT